jgi:hypothetical protein
MRCTHDQDDQNGRARNDAGQRHNGAGNDYSPGMVTTGLRSWGNGCFVHLRLLNDLIVPFSIYIRARQLYSSKNASNITLQKSNVLLSFPVENLTK